MFIFKKLKSKFRKRQSVDETRIQVVPIVDQVIENKYNRTNLNAIFRTNRDVLYKCIIDETDKGTEALKILFENGITNVMYYNFRYDFARILKKVLERRNI